MAHAVGCGLGLSVEAVVVNVRCCSQPTSPVPAGRAMDCTMELAITTTTTDRGQRRIMTTDCRNDDFN